MVKSEMLSPRFVGAQSRHIMFIEEEVEKSDSNKVKSPPLRNMKIGG